MPTDTTPLTAVEGDRPDDARGAPVDGRTLPAGDRPDRPAGEAGARLVDGPCPGASADAPAPRSTQPARRSARLLVMAASVAALEDELERRERRLQRVVDRYEALLDVRARAHRDIEGFDWSDRPASRAGEVPAGSDRADAGSDPGTGTPDGAGGSSSGADATGGGPVRGSVARVLGALRRASVRRGAD